MWEGKITAPVLRNFGTRLASVIRIKSQSLYHDRNRPRRKYNEYDAEWSPETVWTQ